MFEFFDTLEAWPKTGMLLVATFIVHLIISRIVLRGMKQMASRTDNDLDDRLVHFLQRFYVIVLIFVAFLISLRIHGIQITPFLAIAGIAIGMAAKETLADILANIAKACQNENIALASPRVHVESV